MSADLAKLLRAWGDAPWWSMHPQAAAGDDEPEAYSLDIYGPIFDEAWFEGEVGANEVVRAIRALPPKAKLTVHVNSPGGSAFGGIAIQNAIRDHKGYTVVRVDGLAASAASVIAMGGRRLEMSRGAMMMIHRAWALCIGNATDMRKFAADIEKLDGSMADIYAAKSGKPAAELLDLMDAETWLTGPEARDLGLADKADGGEVAAMALAGLAPGAQALACAARDVFASAPDAALRRWAEQAERRRAADANRAAASTPDTESGGGTHRASAAPARAPDVDVYIAGESMARRNTDPVATGDINDSPPAGQGDGAMSDKDKGAPATTPTVEALQAQLGDRDRAVEALTQERDALKALVDDLAQRASKADEFELRVQQLEKANAEARRDAFVEAAIRDNLILPTKADREKFAALFEENEAVAKAMVETRREVGFKARKEDLEPTSCDAIGSNDDPKDEVSERRRWADRAKALAAEKNISFGDAFDELRRNGGAL